MPLSHLYQPFVVLLGLLALATGNLSVRPIFQHVTILVASSHGLVVHESNVWIVAFMFLDGRIGRHVIGVRWYRLACGLLLPGKPGWLALGALGGANADFSSNAHTASPSDWSNSTSIPSTNTTHSTKWIPLTQPSTFSAVSLPHRPSITSTRSYRSSPI